MWSDVLARRVKGPQAKGLGCEQDLARRAGTYSCGVMLHGPENHGGSCYAAARARVHGAGKDRPVAVLSFESLHGSCNTGTQCKTLRRGAAQTIAS